MEANSDEPRCDNMRDMASDSGSPVFSGYPDGWEPLTMNGRETAWGLTHEGIVHAERSIGGEDEKHLNEGLKNGWLKWIGVRNRRTSEVFYLRLERTDPNDAYQVVAIIRPRIPGHPITSKTFTNLPLASIVGADARADALRATEYPLIWERMFGNLPNYDTPFAPLPKTNLNDPTFLKCVAWQYTRLLIDRPGTNPVTQMQQINGKSLPTVNSWLTAARKAGILHKLPNGGRYTHKRKS